MKFLNLETGYSFDGLWTNEQSKGYIFWFPSEQSINITYTMPICIVSKEQLDDNTVISIEDNDVFSCISHTADSITVDGFDFDGKPKYMSTMTVGDLDCESINNNYIYVFNVACKSVEEGEYICKITIGDYGYIRVGADFYGENESLYVNLANFGTEIPETIQKAIYDSNVHEDFKDNILINRKFKELLSNYWDVIANKGSYKSLQNSLKWFEWGDKLEIKEIWRHLIADKSFFNDEEVVSIFESKLNDSFENYVKTTYISLYCSLYDERPENIGDPEYDSEFNPVLSNAVLKYSINDIKLKLSLLAQFFGSFFLPIHMSILHAVAETKVFTNTIKTVLGSVMKRNDCFGSFEYVESNIKDDSIYKMTNVRAQVTDATTFAIKWKDPKYDKDGNVVEEYNHTWFGVDEFTSKGKVDKSNINTFAVQYYTGPGLILPIEMIIPNQYEKDMIHHTIADVMYNDHIERLHFYDKFVMSQNKFKIKFNYLIKEAADYTIRFTFFTAAGKTITRTLKFTVEDADNFCVNVYKVQAKDDIDGLTYDDFNDTDSCGYLFKAQKKDEPEYYTQVLPYMLPTNPLYKSYKGIKLSRLVIFDIQNKNDRAYSYGKYEQMVIRGLMDNDFLEFDRVDDAGNITYMVFVSKYFYADVPQEIIDKKYNIIRNELIFLPQFHKLTLMTGLNADNYTVSQYEAVCCAAEINTLYGVKPFRYSHLIDSAEWTFINATNNSMVYHPSTSRAPFVATEKTYINPGYYDISFKYSLTNGIADECKLDSGFRIKVI